MFKNVVVGWLGRRALEVGGLIGMLWSAYTVLPPSRQEIINRIFTGEWQDITLGALVPFGGYVISQVLSFRATVKPQAVTPDGTKVSFEKLDPSTRAKVHLDVLKKKNADPVQPGRFSFPNPLDWFIKR